ncbi:hypothetical protein R0J89_20765, partial [Psychrobacter sp. SIMBA_152]
QAACISEKLGISFFVFEEGYLRPDYITLQEHVNEFAKLVTHIIDNAYLNGEVIRLDGAIRMV